MSLSGGDLGDVMLTCSKSVRQEDRLVRGGSMGSGGGVSRVLLWVERVGGGLVSDEQSNGSIYHRLRDCGASANANVNVSVNVARMGTDDTAFDGIRGFVVYKSYQCSSEPVTAYRFPICCG